MQKERPEQLIVGSFGGSVVEMTLELLTTSSREMKIGGVEG